MVERSRGRVESQSAETLWVAAIMTTALLFVGFSSQRFLDTGYPRGARTGRQDLPQRGLEPGRGRLAERPSDIPAPGWKDIVWRVYQNIGNDRVVALAAGVTFY